MRMLTPVKLHWRLIVGLAAGVAIWGAAPLFGAPPAARFLIGWIGGALIYLAVCWRLFLTDDGQVLRRRAAAEDEPPLALLGIVLAAVAAGLVGIVLLLGAAHRAGEAARAPAAGLAGAALVVSWLVLQTVFVLHYAHRHFGDRNRDGAINGGFEFPGEPARTYMDFVYLSICIGATFQVSDTNVLTARLRNLITAHAAVAYIYNTAVLALGINIIAGLIGGG
ncbi:DUF1345 domain-containing protein [Caulobacter sp. CCUG 60055]|uniref:DUF1345 domain-containing protein n=1 Tax=Caulobacter sp. CCUG 60055 TaxID=2100090 RepID=UPI001FA7CB60|nr:DUF1345 domain-containing protein [Caulobacter sp. CCUG 60055]MBQ1541022.1 DUF1345 domain-containing protein [Caulobacteraceae bacterium]MCI3179073.1 DUF1345 domain-containing protein [Caulobacter sp. CCUG 60055]